MNLGGRGSDQGEALPLLPDSKGLPTTEQDLQMVLAALHTDITQAAVSRIADTLYAERGINLELASQRDDLMTALEREHNLTWKAERELADLKAAIKRLVKN